MIEKKTGIFTYRTIQLNMEVFQIENINTNDNESKEQTESNKLHSPSLPYSEKY